ncbi:histidine triad nucleotide-binding protein [Acidaminobacter hydrogenoformans]|uniref:Histidine triad (HIT) family protein n=1 Tax=Acidaminobacter hydrogenoformans DSM 2784 TaxID=1120920 RepID=A0A1G5RTX1_9FIRM|nr:histidine triad nucleotide-binding protein [Acidaminobacter hydrogenoformans]SCZ77160.1 histidine triad (HIT) family protein [Acidaminobacter hydrogenoformans DSM 2784]
MKDCLFCKIVNGEIPSNKAFEDQKLVVFHDISPVAPVHVLIVPKKHLKSLNEVGPEDADLIAHVFKVAAQVAAELGVSENGYRVVNNCGKDGGQTVDHLHFHLLGGRYLDWPPG